MAALVASVNLPLGDADPGIPGPAYAFLAKVGSRPDGSPATTCTKVDEGRDTAFELKQSKPC